jgi:diaminopimelate epimerase
MNLSFEKWHGTQNDFVFLENWKKEFSLSAEHIQYLCHRRLGVGADAVILFESSNVADAKMNYFNADGSFAESCGNGLRATAAFGKKHGYFSGDTVQIENPNGRVDTIHILSEDPWDICVNLGLPKTTGVPDFPDDFLGKPISMGDADIDVWCVSMGNPHAVQFVDSITDAPVTGLGPFIENHALFPNRINAEFIEIISPTEGNMRVWERGSGETLACGTGAAASVVAGTIAGKFAKNADVLLHLPGGDLKMKWDQEKNTVFKTGRAEFVFRGQVSIDA